MTVKIGISAILLALLLVETQSLARPEFQDRVPNGHNVPDYQRLGHVVDTLGDDRLNNFGRDFRSAGFVWTEALCQKDSDGDGFSNGHELGDAECRWTPASPTPLRSTDLTHPGLASSAPASSPQNETDSDGAGPSGADAASTYEFNMWIAHGVLMAFAFGLFLPLGALIPAINSIRRRPGNVWFKLHATFQTLFLLLAWIGFLIAMFNVAIADQNLRRVATQYPHGQLGIALMVLISVQFLFGAFRPHLPAVGQEKSASRLIFEAIHPQLGRILIVIAAVQIWYGYQLINTYIASGYTRNAISIWAYVHAIAMPILWFIVVLYSKYQVGKVGFSTQYATTLPATVPNPAVVRKSGEVGGGTIMENQSLAATAAPGEQDKYGYQDERMLPQQQLNAPPGEASDNLTCTSSSDNKQQ